MEPSVAAFAFSEDMLTFDEYLDVLMAERAKNKRFLAEFDLDKLTDHPSVQEFRFTKRQIHRISEIMEFPDFMCTENRTKMKGIDTLCLLLRRLSYPQRLNHDVDFFGE